MNSNLMTRGLRKFQDMLGKSRQPKPLDERGLEKLRAQLQECADGLGGEVSARQRALRLGETYQRLDEAGKQAFLRLIATGFGPDPEKVAQAHAEYQQAIGTPAQWEAEARLWSALRSPRTRILTQFNALPQGVRFLVELRVDLLRFLQETRNWPPSTGNWSLPCRPGLTWAFSNCGASPGIPPLPCWKS